MPHRTVVREIALALQDLAGLEKQVWITVDIPDPPPPVLTLVPLVERKRIGDILSCRVPREGVGLKERSEYIWLRVRGKWTDLAELKSSLNENGTKYEKRRYCIPLERLEQIDPSFDTGRALDLSDDYQPFLPIDKETGLFLFQKNKVYDIKGLVYDKLLGTYL